LVSIDFFTVPTLHFQMLYVFLVLAHDRWRILHLNVTAHPTVEWTGQQLRAAFPFDPGPRYLLRDRDAIFGHDFREQRGNCVTGYLQYSQQSRKHLSVNKDSPEPRPIQPAEMRWVVAVP
jgi:hypothetical protein